MQSMHELVACYNVHDLPSVLTNVSCVDIYSIKQDSIHNIYVYNQPVRDCSHNKHKYKLCNKQACKIYPEHTLAGCSKHAMLMQISIFINNGLRAPIIAGVTWTICFSSYSLLSSVLCNQCLSHYIR